ncbi:MAG: siroheme synthase CysG [Devosia sp.]|nr:siroheme synthase CysG [Devosia sp.]
MRIVSRPPSEAAPARIEPLACLPVFFSLTGKRAVVAGGRAAAAWKAELLAAAGAHVEVFAPADGRSDELIGLARQAGSAGSIRLEDSPWRPEHLHGAALAVADIEDIAEAARFAAAATAAAVPFNVIDKPEFCQFQFGAIVNRSPVVVGISTSGAAPILGQAVRRRIETLLPASLGDWGRLALRLRSAVMARLESGWQRRLFWERFVDGAFGPPPDGGDEATLFAAIGQDWGKAGRVTLVGAGPGDAELLTLKAVRALQAADVILFDDLVSPEVLELARREARRLLVGKRGRRASCKQEDINALMLSLARQGKNVVRLKAGDPMIFGRAGEEIAALRDAGIAVEVVPGVTAAIALASRLGVSLTHRDHAQSVRFVTGHSRDGELPAFDWAGLADPATTTVYYMSRATLPRIVEKLIEHGMDPSSPSVLAADVGRDGEFIWRGRLVEAPGVVATIADHAAVLFATGAALQDRAIDAKAGRAIAVDQTPRRLGERG